MTPDDMADRAFGGGARSIASIGLGLGAVVWLITSVLVAGFAVGAKEACSSEVGSVSQVGTAELLLPCDLVGWLAGSTTIGALLVLGLATLGGAWQRWSTALAVIASVIALQAICVAGLSATHLI